MKFYLGTHETSWLGRTDVPLFISHRRLAKRKSFPRAVGTWALDSGGFTELSQYGRWLTSPDAYVRAVYRYRDEIGQLDWAAPQDWMCEPWIVAKTGLTVADHQRHTVENYLDLRAAAPDLPFVPVLQGWTLDDYLACVDMYDAAGVDLSSEPTVGVGSVCRRQSTYQIESLMAALCQAGLRLHGFGVKTSGLSRYGWALKSADSMAWSFTARRGDPLPGCAHRSCSSCLPYALGWRERVLSRLRVQQPQLALEVPA